MAPRPFLLAPASAGLKPIAWSLLTPDFPSELFVMA